MFPLAIHHDGRLGSTIRLYAESEDVQLTWTSKLNEAILFRQKSTQVFEASVVAREEFLTMGSGGSLHTYPPANRPITGMITCANPFGPPICFTFVSRHDLFFYHSDTRWAYFVGHWVCRRLVDRDREGPSMSVFSSLTTKAQELTRAPSFSLGAPPPRPTVRCDRGTRFHSYPFQRSTRKSSECLIILTYNSV